MNRENAAAFLPLVQALAEGKTIQYNHDVKGWIDDPNPCFDQIPCGSPSWWRIKPEPREWWISFNKGSQPNEIKSDAGIYNVEQFGIGDHRQQIRVREILDDEP